MKNPEYLHPAFPIKVTWKEDGEVETYENYADLISNLEQFFPDDNEADVVDAKGRPIRLEVDITQNLVRVEFA